MDATWREALGQSIGLARAERALAKARWNFLAARLVAWVNPTMRICVEETRKSLEFWRLIVSELRAA